MNGEITWDQFSLLSQGHVAFNALYSAANDFDLFSLIEANDNITSNELRELIGLKEYPYGILIDSLLTLGLVKQSSDKIYNSKIASEFLVKGKEKCFAPTFEWQKHIVYPGIVDFTEALKQETNVGLRHFSGTEKYPL